MTTKAQLKFHKFQNFACQVQQKMRGNEFCNVTLVSAFNKKFEAHKVILAAYSNLFQKMLVSEKHPNPLICMRGVDGEALGALLDLIYFGEAKLSNENLDSFVQLSKDIELQGIGTADTLERETLNEKKTNKKRSKPVSTGTRVIVKL